ncbi:MAG: type VI secretion system Vgr family protein [Telluria sp.]
MADLIRSTKDLLQTLFAVSTDTRPLRLNLGLPDGFRDDVLMPERVSGREAVCGGIEYRILCVADDATLALKDFLAAPAELQIVTDRGGLRTVCGFITEAASGQSDGALATYQLVLQDALALMERRSNTRVFRNMNELDVISTLVDEWRVKAPPLSRWFSLQVDAALAARELPRREFIMQHNESDAAFIRRLLKRRGIAWYFRPGRTAPDPSPASHTLVLFDDPQRLPQSEAGAVRFHRDDGTEERDTITSWSAVRTLQPGSVTLHSWDYRNPGSGPFMQVRTDSRSAQGPRAGELAALLDEYRVLPPHAGDSPLDLTEIGEAAVSHEMMSTKCFRGEGSVRDLAAGEWFEFDDHPEVDTHPRDERRFVVTELEVVAQNHLPTDLAARVERLFGLASVAGDGAPVRYRAAFTCVRRGIRIVPRFDPAADLPRPQLQSAIVVGPPDEEVWCDELGRVKVRFPATRPEDHAHSAGAGSNDADCDSAWIRVASSWAGNGPGTAGQCGGRLLPPVGAEVLVDFAGGDPDKPVIIGQVYNGAAPPPRFAEEAALPQARYQSGLRTREIRGRRGNQLRMDDTPGQISAQLASDHAGSELNLGYLTERRRDGTPAPRGEGAELRSDEAIALRAARGILLSAWKMLGGGEKGGQLARAEFLGLLRECGELCDSLGGYASAHQGLDTDPKARAELLERFARWDDGSNVQPSAQEPREPVVGITSAAGIGFASSQAIVSYSARNIDTAAQHHVQTTAGQRFNVNAGQGIGLFAHHGGLHAIAHFGQLVLQSQHDDAQVAAAKNVTITASQGKATIAAKVILLVAEDGSFLRLGDGPPVLGSKNTLQFHASDFKFEGAQTEQAPLPNFGGDGTNVQFGGRYYLDQDGGIPAAAVPHALNGNQSPVPANEQGLTAALQSDAVEPAAVEFFHPDSVE